MRVYGRVMNPDGSKTWQIVQTDTNGFNDMVYLVALIQCLKLNLNESPFYSQFGIPAQPSIIQQIFPDFYVNFIQSQYASFFASLRVIKLNAPSPIYDVNLITNYGSTINTKVPV